MQMEYGITHARSFTLIHFVLHYRSFIVQPDAANIAIFRYNRRVDTATQVFLNSYPGDIEGLIAALGRIPYNGSGKIHIFWF